MRWQEHLLNWVFPVACVDCGGEGEWWCSSCAAKQPVQVTTQVLGGELLSITAFFSFSEHAPLAQLLHLFKYQYVTGIADTWKHLVQGAKVDIPPGYVLMPVPLHKRRERERGYNQASILAGIFAELLQMPYSTHHLSRVKKTAQQATLARSERFLNVADAFTWLGNERVPERVLLVDDVFTTGATMEACAKALKAAGAISVRGLVLARPK